MTQSIQDIMNDMMKMREFTVEVEVPVGLSLDGLVPYKDTPNKGLFKIYALSQDDAQEKVLALVNSLV
jgi:hypothetical protein